jgi:hypothetical protein
VQGGRRAGREQGRAVSARGMAGDVDGPAGGGGVMRLKLRRWRAGMDGLGGSDEHVTTVRGRRA